MCEKIAIINQQTIVRYENTEESKMHGVLLSGSVKAIEPLVEGHTILEKRKLGKQINVMIDGVYTDEWISRAKEAGVTVKRHHYRIILLTIQRKKRCIKYEYLYWTIPINDERNEIDILYKCCNYFCAICFL